MTTERTELIENLKPDKNNANRGTPRGKKLLRSSLKKFGTGRSILLDKNNQVIAGNKTLSEAKHLGHKKVIVVDSDGDTLIAVRRNDLDLSDKAAKELALLDNRVNEVGLSWETDVLKETDVDLSEMFEPIELDALLNEGKNTKRTDRIDLQQPPKMIWILLGVPFSRFDAIQAPLAAIEEESEITVQQARNE